MAAADAPSPSTDLARRLLAEGLGTAFLLVAVVGSALMAGRQSPGDPGFQLLVNAAATGAALVGLIATFAAVSGAHFNPAVSLAARLHGTLGTGPLLGYVAAQLVGAAGGVIVANVMFGRSAIEMASTTRASGPLWLSEVVATVGLLLVIQGSSRSDRPDRVPLAVGLWIAGAYWFTSSTSFANPAVTIGRTLSDSFAGIAPGSVPVFVAMQLIGVALAYGAGRILYPPTGTAR